VSENTVENMPIGAKSYSKSLKRKSLSDNNVLQ